MSRFRIGDTVRIAKDTYWYDENDKDHPLDSDGIVTDITRNTLIFVKWSDVPVLGKYNDDELKLRKRP